MISILIVDDNSDKIKAIINSLTEIPDILHENIVTALDGNSGKQKLKEKSFDLLILDLSLPLRIGDNPEKDGGVKFLDEIEMDDEIILPFHIIGITAYDNLKTQFQEKFSLRLWHLIYFEQEFNEWSDKLQTYIRYLVKSKSELKDASNAKYNFDLAIITALSLIELDSILKLPANWQKFIISNDHTIYYKGIFRQGNKKLSVVAAASDQMGLTAATLLSQKLINNFRPKLLAMTGIAAGIKGKTNMGDIIVSELSWDYGSGKIVTSSDGSLEFRQDPRPIPLDPDLKAIVKNEEMSQEYIPQIEFKWKSTNGKIMPNKIKLVCGPIASGSYVIENIDKIQEVVDQQRKLVAIDMETYGVFYSGFYSTYPKPKVISMKGICDFGDNNKNDDFQSYAAFNSANYLYEFVLRNL